MNSLQKAWAGTQTKGVRFFTFVTLLLLSSFLTAQQLKLNIDYQNSEVRSKRVKLALEVNKGIDFDGVIKISFGADINSLTTHTIDNVLVSEDYNLKTYYFEQEDLDPNTIYIYKWYLETDSLGDFETEFVEITTPSIFDVLPYQLFEIPEEGIIPGDTIGYIKYEDTNGSWKKIKTYYKTSLGLKTDGTLWAWGRNAKRLVVNPSSQSEVVYEPIQINKPPEPDEIDSDGDGFWDIDETDYGNSNPNDPDSVPVNSDDDFLSDALENFIGMDPNNGDITWEEDKKLFEFFLEKFSDPEDALKFYDFEISRTSVIAIEEETRHLWFWGVGMGNSNLDRREYDLDQSNPNPESGRFYFPNGYTPEEDDNSLPPFNYAIADMSTGFESIFEFPYVIDSLKRWDKVSLSNNYTTPKFQNLNNLGEIYDTTVAGITTDGELFIWGIVDGLLLPNYIEVGVDKTWVDVKVGDAIIALANDGTIHEIGMDIPQNANNSTLDKDNDGVPDATDAFEWDPNYQYDSDEDGFPDKAEDERGTDKNNPDTDGDGVTDAEDQLPLDPNYSKDSDFDGLPDELDPNDDNWDSDGDGTADGDDADPLDPTKKWDCDGDGLSDEDEWEQFSDPCVLDTDGDGVDDKDDKYPRTFYYQYDSDGDGLPDALEVLNETDPNSSDTDGDGYLDAIAASKFNYFRDLANNLDCSQGWDRCDQWQYFWRFWDIKYDCDGNGWVSWEEWEGTADACASLQPRDDFPTDPNANLDSDRDGDPDNTDPDDDNDGFEDEVELNENVNTDPLDWQSQPLDSDGDQLPDGIEKELGTDPFNWDSDGDFSGDGWDAWPLDPKLSWDDDKDKLENWIEVAFLGTDPNEKDTDGDGVDDFEDAFPIDPDYSLDTDGDGLADAYEDANGLNKNSKDSDGDGYYDAPCNKDKMVLFTDNYGNSWYEPNWRECEGSWEQNSSGTWEYSPSTWIEDEFPTEPTEHKDSDGDGTGDNADTDDDNDGYSDDNDDFPTDPTEWLNTDKPTIDNGYLKDYDNDGIYGEDTNNDGWIDEVGGDWRRFDFIGNNKDPDDDGDLFLDVDEIANGTDPLDKDDYPQGDVDPDQDGFSNLYEATRGTDPNNWDSDGDGVSDGWQYPNHSTSYIWQSEDTWEDSFFRDRDTNSCCSWYYYKDGELVGDGEGELFIDQFPNDDTEYWDTDGDSIPDNTDTDDDNDGLSDVYETTVKRSGWDWTVSNPYKKDTDGDGVEDGEDAIPWYDRESEDTDGDFQGNNEDMDDDGDGMQDSEEKELGLDPLNPDSDGDGWFDGDCNPNAILIDDNGNWRHEISFTGSSTLLNEKYKFSIYFYDTWSSSELVYTTTATMTSVELVSALAEMFNENDFTSEGDPMTATASGSTLILVGEQENVSHNIDMWYLQQNMLRARGNWCDWINKDKFPNNSDEWQDIDHDDIGDNADTDDDNDGLSDAKEYALGTNPYYWDSDGDMFGDDWDQLPLDPTAYLDTDGDGIADSTIDDPNTIIDLDLDGDGLSNEYEQANNLDMYQPDSDWDGYLDGEDIFPNNIDEWLDTDNDLIGNNLDTDDDNDKFSDKDEIFNETDPLDPSSYPADDLDQDFLSDLYEEELGTLSTNQDTDDDGYLDGEDAFPTDATEWLDSDNDGQGNNSDDNDDNDHLNDFVEEFGIKEFGWNVDPLIHDDWESLPYDGDWDGVPDEMENFLSNAASDAYFYGDDETKRKIYRAVKGLRNWENDDGDTFIDSNGNEQPLLNKDDEDADGNGTLDHQETINFYNYDNDTYEDDFGNVWPLYNVADRDSDNDGADDGWDVAFLDSRGSSDYDLDFIHDWDDLDIDNDLVLNNWERLYGTDRFNQDTDGDGVNDGFDFQGYEPRIQSKDDFSADLFNLNQIGTSSNWESIETWNYGQSGASYAAINSEGELFVWGVNYGALPINDEKSKEAWENGEEYGFVISEPTQARPNEKWKGISLGFKFGVGYSTDGTYYSWGRNLSSQLGNGKPTTYESFLEPSISLGEIVDLDAGEQQVGVINKDGKLRMIGSNDQGQLGTGSTNDNTPQELDWEEIEGTIKEVKVTETETQILTTSNQIWAYGDNLYAQLGRGTRDTKAENYEAKKIDEEGWIEVFAISEHVYAFKSDGSLWAWGKNKNFDLGLGYKSEFVSTPTKVEGVNKNDIIDFSPLRGGFVYINTDGELWGAGTNFYTGSWFPLSSPRKIGNDTDWSHFHDFIGSELNILIEKTDGSIWGAGTNWSRVLTENPCPEAQNQINKISLTHPNSYQKTKIEIGEITGTATYTIKVNGTNLTTGNVSNSTDLIDETVRLFNADNTLTNNFTLTATPTNSGSSTLLFESKNLVENSFSFSIEEKSNDFEGALSILEVEDHISGTVTFTVSLNGTRISAAAGNSTDAVANLKNSFETSENFSDYVNNYSFTTSGTSLLIENIKRESFFTTVEVVNSSNSDATIETSTIQDRLDVNCWPRYLNNLVEIFPSGNSWDKIALGIKHAIGLDDNGLLYSWGQNDQLQLGLGSNKWDPKSTPTQITSTGTKTFSDIDASAEVSFAIDSDGNMYAWGDNDLGTLAVGDYSDKPYPTLVKGDITWKSNLGGYRFQVALDQDDKPYGWGYRKFGQLGALGKVKGDDIVWDTDLSESQGTIEALNEGEYLIATQEFINYLETLYNFENYGDSSSSKSNSTSGTIQKASEFSPQQMKYDNKFPSRGKNVGKWKVKKTKSIYSGKSSISEDSQASSGEEILTSQDTPYSFSIVDVNEQPSDIILTDLQSKITQKANQFISSITLTDPDQDDIVTVTIPSNSPNQDKFSIKNQKLYFDGTTSKATVPYQLILRATDWEGLILEKQFEILVDDQGNILIEEQDTSSSDGGSSSGGGSSYNERFSDSDGDGFVDADEFLIGTDPFDFRSFPSDFDNDGILDYYDGDIDNDGYLNEDDQFPLNQSEWIDADQDGIGDNADIDDDNDGIPDIDVNWAENYIIQDLFPNDPNETSDFDKDGIGDNADLDDDNDGYEDTLDAFPYNPYEWLDFDNDGIGNNEDPDNDNDGYSNLDENAIGTNPLDPNDYPADLDGDFVPDIIDFDRDGDGISNDFDTAPDLYNPNQEFIDNANYVQLVFQEFFSPNGDGINDNFEIGEIQRYPNNKVWIYDSVGNLVFETQGYNNSWQGTSNGNPLPKGSYLYRVDADGNGTTEYQGWIYLTR